MPGNQSHSDEELMERYRDGDAGAFDVLYGRHKGGLFRYMLRQCGSRGIAEELFQEVWMNLIRARETYAVHAKFTTYLYRLAHNRLIDHYRSQAGRVPLSIEDDDCPALDGMPGSPCDDPALGADHREQAARLLQLIEALPEAQREAFLLQQESGMSVEEIAQSTGVSRETAKSRLPLALAAVVLLSVTLVTVMREEAHEVMLPPSVESTPAEAQHMRSGPAVDARERAAAVPQALAPDVPRSERVGPRSPQRSPAAGVGLDGSSGSPDSASTSRQDTIAASRMESDVPAAPALARRATREALPGDPGMRDEKLATPAAPPSMPLPAPQVAGAVLPDAELPPDKWVERIVALRAQGKLEEAKSSLAELRKRYPEYALPASLKDWGRP